MKSFITSLLLLLSLITANLHAQVSIGLNVDSHPTPRISQWVDRTNLAILTVTNTEQSMVGMQYQIKVEMYLDGDLVLETNNDVAIQTLDLGTQTFLADEIIPYSALEFHKQSFRNHILQTGLLPAGAYDFCVSILDLDGNLISTPEKACQPMIITEYQMPELLTPANGDEIESQLVPSIIFRWTPLTPTPPAEEGIKYKIIVSKVEDGQSPGQAFHVNYPIIEEVVLIGTQFMWPTDLDAPEENTQYVWSVKPLSDDDMPYKMGANGFVDVHTFNIKSTGANAESEDNECICNNPNFENPPITIERLYPEQHPKMISILGLVPTVALVQVCDNGNNNSPIEVQTTVTWDDHHILEVVSVDQVVSHEYSPQPLFEHKIPDEIIIKINKQQGSNYCTKTYHIPVPLEIRNAINGTSICECTNSLSQPVLSLSRPEPINHPRKIELHNIMQLKDFVRDCNDNYKEIDSVFNTYKYTFTPNIYWFNDDNPEGITNNGPFQHEYSLTDTIPSQVCVKIAIDPKPGYSGVSCVREFCVDVPQNILDTNPGNTPTGTISANDTIYAGHNGEFAVIATQLTSANGKYSGAGTVYIDWLKARMSVHFDSITVDTNKKLLTGKILAEIYDAPAPVYPQDWALEVVSNNPMTNNIAGNIVSWVENTTGQNIDYNGLNEYTTPVKLPLGVNMPNNDQLAITEMVFRPNKSEFNLVAAKETPPDWGNPQQLVGFEAKNIQFHPNQIVTPPERIELIEDVYVGNPNNNIAFTFKAPATNHPGCYIEWNENGFSQFGLELEAAFTRDWLIPVPDDGVSKSAANLTATGTDWNDLLFVGNLPDSEIVDSDGMTIEANTISYDMSDVINPPNMVFPENYPAGADTSDTFRGFYMKNLNVKLPHGWQTHAGGQPEISVQDMIINNTGLTLYAEATNVAQFPSVEVADMSASIDTVFVNISASSLVEAGIQGRLALPVSKVDSIQNPLQYNALFHVAQNPTEHTNFQLSIEPTGPIYAYLLKGQMTLSPTSNIIGYVDKNKRTFQSTLNGNFEWNDVQLGPVKHVNFNLEFQGIEFNYNSSLANNKMQFDAGHWSFASPQKFLANFPVTIENIDFSNMATNSNQYLHGKLNFDVIFNLSNNIGGQSKMGVELSVEKNPSGSQLGKFKPKYIGTSIDDVSVYAHLSAVTVDGTLQFRNEDPVYGNGFKGELSATFKTPHVSITALGEFGNTEYLYSSTYRYWRVEAAAKFQPGLPFLPGVSFYGFGGGAYSNMESTLVQASGNDPAKYTFSPHKGNLGFKVQATIGSTPKVESFNADVGLQGQFSSSQGLIDIGFDGAFYVGAPLMPQTKRNKAQIKGTLLANYNFPDKHFYFNTTVDINKPPAVVAQNQNIVLDINGKTNNWYMKFGEPTNVNNASIFNFNLYEYLMFGNDIQAPANGFTEGFRQSYHSTLGTYPGMPSAPGVNNNSATGRGFALGVGFSIDKDVDKNLVGSYKLYLALAAGAEVNLSMMEYNGQNCANPSQRIGFNGWRARGSIGFYVNAAADVKKGSQTWNIANIKVGGWLDAKFPRPTYVTGAVDGDVQIGHWTTRQHPIVGDCTHSACNGGRAHAKKKYKNTSNAHRSYTLGWNYQTSCTHYVNHYLVNTSFHKTFDWGDNCGANDTNASPDAGPAAQQEDAAADQEQNLIKYVHAGPMYYYPVTKPVSVKYGLPINEAFDVTEQQADGSVITRTFKLEKQVWLKVQDSSNNYIPLYLKEDQNSIGEYLYTKGVVTTGTISFSGNFPTTSNTTPPNNNNAGGMIAGRITTYTSYPAPTPSQTSEYDNLPPETPPVVNHLQQDKNYKIIVKATLKEFINNTWINATKSDGTPVTQTVSKSFRTGPMEVVQVNNTSRSSR